MQNTLRSRSRRATRTRGKIRATGNLPRLSVYRSNVHIAVQVIDDAAKKTLFGLSEKTLSVKGTKTERAKALGLALAKVALEKHIKAVTFDKGPYRYHGRVKALAQGAREGGLTF